jgi:hypothetical protein
VLERFYGYGEDPREVYSNLVATDRELIADSGGDDKKFESEAELGQIMIDGYLEWLEETGADRFLEVVATERKVEVPLLDGMATLIGKLDMKVRNLEDGSISFIDHKTSANFADFMQTAHMNEQLLTYSILERGQELGEDEWSKSGIYNLLKKVKRTASAKPPFYTRMEITFNPTTIASFRKRLESTVSDMIDARTRLAAGEDPLRVVYPYPTRECSWFCPFMHSCIMFDDGSDIESYLEMNYVKSNPYARYDNLALSGLS